MDNVLPNTIELIPMLIIIPFYLLFNIIPCVGIYFVAKRIGFTQGARIGFGVAMLMPLANLVVPFLLAFVSTGADQAETFPTTPTGHNV